MITGIEVFYGYPLEIVAAQLGKVLKEYDITFLYTERKDFFNLFVFNNSIGITNNRIREILASELPDLEIQSIREMHGLDYLLKYL